MGNAEGQYHLSEDEVQAVQAAWSVVRKDQRNIGRQVMMELLSENPEYIQKFKHLATIPADQLPYHNKLTAHALSILYVIHSLVDSIDDEETLRELIRKVALTHKPGPRNVNRENFKKFEEAFMAVVRSKLDTKTKVALEKCFDFFVHEYELADDLDI